jgi:uncharacterized protein (TIGR02246 family)
MKSVLGLVLVGLSVGAQGQSAADVAAVKDVARRQFSTFERRDAEAYGALFTRDGTFVSVLGERIDGRAAIVQANAEFFPYFNVAKTHIEVKEPSVKFLDARTAVVYEAWSGLWMKRDTEAQSGYMTMVMTRREGRWLIFSATNAFNFQGRKDFDLYGWTPEKR